MDIMEKVKNVVIDTFDGITKEELNANTMLFDHGLNLSSIDTVIFFIALEEKFSVELPDDAYINIKKLHDVEQYINSALNG